MYCAHCGKEIKDDAAFCPECGAAVYKKEGEAAPAAPEDGNFNAAFDAGPAPQPDYAQGNPNPNPDPGAGYVYTPPMPDPNYAQGSPNPQPQKKSSRSKIAAGLLGIFLGGWGIHNFYLGKTSMGVIQIVVTLVTCGIGSLWGFVEGIMCLCGQVTDVDGLPLSD